MKDNIDNLETLPMDLGGAGQDSLGSQGKLQEEDKDKQQEKPEEDEHEHEKQETEKHQEEEQHQLEKKDGKEQPLPETEEDQETKVETEQTRNINTPQAGNPRRTVKQWMSSTEIMAKLASFSKPGSEKRVCHPSPVSFGWRSDAELSKLVKRSKVAVRNSRPNKVESAADPIKPPMNWGKSSYISAEAQCPPKKRGRKRKGEDAEKGQVGKKKAKVPEKTTKTSETGKRGRSKTKKEEKVDDSKSRSKTNTRAKPAKASSSSTQAKSKAKAKGTKPVKAHTEVSQDAAEAERLEKKKKLSRKSAAYHKALKQAKAEGKSEEQCKAAGKKVSNLRMNFNVHK